MGVLAARSTGDGRVSGRPLLTWGTPEVRTARSLAGLVEFESPRRPRSTPGGKTDTGQSCPAGAEH